MKSWHLQTLQCNNQWILPRGSFLLPRLVFDVCSSNLPRNENFDIDNFFCSPTWNSLLTNLGVIRVFVQLNLIPFTLQKIYWKWQLITSVMDCARVSNSYYSYFTYTVHEFCVILLPRLVFEETSWSRPKSLVIISMFSVQFSGVQM